MTVIRILSIVDGKVEEQDLIPFPDPIKGKQTFGIIQQIARNRQQSAIDDLVVESLPKGKIVPCSVKDGGCFCGRG